MGRHERDTVGKRRLPGLLRMMALVMLAVLIAGIAAGCGSSSHDGASGGTASSGSSANVAREIADDAGGMAFANRSTAVNASGDHQVDPQPQAIARKIIYSADVTMEVENFERARDELQHLLAKSGGYMLHFSDGRTTRQISGNFTMKVPADGFQPFLDELEQLKSGNEFRRSVRGQDVTEEFVDLSARLNAKEAVEARLLELMKQAKEAKDLLEFSNELARVQEDIEALKGRMRYINENVAYSTVDLYMYQVIDDGIRRPGDDGLVSRMAEALVDNTQGVLRFLGDLAVFLTGALPVLLLLAVIGVPLGIWIRRTNKKYNTKWSVRQHAMGKAADSGQRDGLSPTDPSGSPVKDGAENKDDKPKG